METSPVDTDQSRVPSILICNILLIIASTVAVCVRLYVRIRYVSIGWDDYFCVVGWVGSPPFSMCNIWVIAPHGIDKGLLILGRDICRVSHVRP
jgi:hypothetical protein